jgi:hypothetical protein
MPIRFTTKSLFLVTAFIAAFAAIARIWGFGSAYFVFLALLGLCVLIRSDWSNTVRERVFLILLGLGLIALALLRLIVPEIH